MALIIPKNNADKETLDATLKVYFEANDWVPNQDLIDKLSRSLNDLGIENEVKEPQSYTKKTQVPAYYGLIEWQDPENNQSPRRITELGRRFYEARINNNQSETIKIIIEALASGSFGRNVLGCASDSDLEAPNIYIKSSLILDGLTNNEFAYILGRMELDKSELCDALLDVVIKRKLSETVMPNENSRKWNDPKPITALKNWGFFAADNKVNLHIIEHYYSDLIKLRTKNTDVVKFSSPEEKQPDEDNGNFYYRQFITAIKSKPFLLLAGISGTGKSRIVRELARSCWDVDSDEFKSLKPSNFEMIQVKPNWHDSSELIGYISRVSGTAVYVAGEFLKFVAKAWENLDIPHFCCLDEMNLAPVEQYFAEYLSVIESRKTNDDRISTDPIVRKSQDDWYRIITAELSNGNDTLRDQFLADGITIPQNLIVVGTVNMDETTFSFSRKVLDRAMTIEMNDVDLRSGLSSKFESIGKLGEADLIGNAVEGVDVYQDNKDVCDPVLEYLQSINAQLESTPFKIAYRTRNEFLLYVINNLPYNKDSDDNEISQNIVIARALDEITSMKILSRIEGDETKVSNEFLNNLSDTIKEKLQEILGEDNPLDESRTISLLKLKEMKDKLRSGYTSFWS